MLTVETIAKIRRMYHVQEMGFKTIARKLNLSKNTVKSIIRSDKTSNQYIRTKAHYPALGGYIDSLVTRLNHDATEPKRRKRTSMKLFHYL